MDMQNSLLALDAQSFLGALDELGIEGEQRDFLLREKRKYDSSFGGLMDFGATPEGQKRATILPMVSPEGMTGWDAITSGQAQLALPSFITGAVEGAAKAIDLPRASLAMQVPPADLESEAMNMAGMASLGAASTAGTGLFDYDPNTTRVFAGPRAATADLEALERAKRLAAAKADPAQTRGFLADESGSLPLPFSSPLPKPRNEAEAIAKEILELRATGNVDAVTDSMMDAADPQYMYAHTPLPMDEASRLARAREMGAVEEYHGTTTGSDMRYPSPYYGSGSRKGIGFVTSSSPYVSSSYAAPDFGGAVFPMLNRPPEGGFAVVDTSGDLWSNIPSDARVVLPSGRETTVASYASVPDEHTGGYRTDYISRGAAIEGDGGVKFENIIDRGIHTPRVKDDPSVALEFQREASKPSSVMFRHDTRGMRSKFARFDPMFAHLRSLSAGVAPFGLLAFQPNEEQYR